MVPKRILFCTDFSENSRAARSCASDYAQVFDASLTILHVINSSEIGFPSLDETIPVDIQSTIRSIEESVDKALELITRECRKKIAKVVAHKTTGTPSYEIVKYAENQKMELIVLGTHGWTGFRHLIMGSTAENVVRTAHCPVLTVRSIETPKRKRRRFIRSKHM
jgi:universal stress protein A